MPENGEAERATRLLARGGWRTEVDNRCRELEHRLTLARPGQHGAAVEQSLRLARLAIDPPAQDRFARLAAWWTGSAVTLAWESAHDAEGELLEVEDDGAVRSQLPRLVDWMLEVMDKRPLRDRYEDALTEMAEGKTSLDRTVVRQAHQDITRENNEFHARLRTLRNLLIAATATLAVLLLALAIWHAINPHVLSLCSNNASGSTGCLNGGTKPGSSDILLVELVGAIAGLLSAATALGSLKTVPSRYNVTAAQIALKLAAGAATAVIGVLLVQSNILVRPANTGGEALLLAYAAIFGFSQQLLTRFVDKRAGALLGE